MRAACRFLPLLLALLPAAGHAETWRLDPVHTRVLFVVDHAGLSQALGTLSGAQGVLEFSPDDWTGARVELVLPLASLDLGDADWRERVLDGTFLAAGRHPQARFVSTGVTAIDPTHATVHGLLTLRGVEAAVDLDVQVNAVKRHPITQRRTAGFSATARIDRRDFGMNAWPNVVGRHVELRIEAEAILDRDAQPPPAADGPAAEPTPAPEPAHEESADADPQHR